MQSRGSPQIQIKFLVRATQQHTKVPDDADGLDEGRGMFGANVL